MKILIFFTALWGSMALAQAPKTYLNCAVFYQVDQGTFYYDYGPFYATSKRMNKVTTEIDILDQNELSINITVQADPNQYFVSLVDHNARLENGRVNSVTHYSEGISEKITTALTVSKGSLKDRSPQKDGKKITDLADFELVNIVLTCKIGKKQVIENRHD